MKSFDVKKFDRLVEGLSALLIALATLAVAVGFIRLALDHWGYLVPLAIVIIGGIFIATRIKRPS
jgi:uncharacterized membrane protein